MRRYAFLFPALAALVLVGCTDRGGESAAEPEGGHVAGQGSTPTNRIDIPSNVRSNLGITFATVEPRFVERTLRVPGRFELLPTARREYRTMLPGRVELLVEQYERVDAGTPLFRIDSPGWREVQQKLTDLDATIRQLETKLETFEPLLAAHHAHEQGLFETVGLWEDRIKQLEAVRDAGGGRSSELATARSSLSSARSALGEVQEKDANLAASRAETVASLDGARARRAFQLTTAASLLGRDADQLLEVHDDGRALWATIDVIEVVAEEPGIIETLGLTNGSWADQQIPVATAVQPDRLRFHARGLQSDLGRLRDGLAARIVPPSPTRVDGSIDMQDTMAGTLSIGITGNPDERTIDLYAVPEQLSDWARPGVSAHLEIVTDGTKRQSLAIPLAAVQRDGLVPVIFRRDPKDPNTAIRIEADLGIDDGRWIVVRSGVRTGDEVVLDGAYQLMLAMSGSVQQGGHFHADGTYHEGED